MSGLTLRIQANFRGFLVKKAYGEIRRKIPYKVFTPTIASISRLPLPLLPLLRPPSPSSSCSPFTTP